jgi:hypothetical protein
VPTSDRSIPLTVMSFVVMMAGGQVCAHCPTALCT